VAFGNVAIDQMLEQEVSDIEILRFLCDGAVFRTHSENINNNNGSVQKWLCRILDSSGRSRRTVTAVIKLGGIYVLTVSWDILS
jgi:hypothetical protein